MSEIKGLHEAIERYNEVNSGGGYDPWYGRLMYDKSTGEVWTDEFYDLGHNQFKKYYNDDIINLGFLITDDGLDITEVNVKKYIREIMQC